MIHAALRLVNYAVIILSVRAPHLRQQRKREALTIRQLAEKADVGTATIARLERGEDGYATTIRKLATALKVKPAELMEEPS